MGIVFTIFAFGKIDQPKVYPRLFPQLGVQKGLPWAKESGCRILTLLDESKRWPQKGGHLFMIA